MNDPIELRAPEPDEAGDLADLGRATFVETFGHLYQPEDLAQFLAKQYDQRTLAKELADPRLTFRVLARQGELLGFIKLGPLHLPVTEPPPDAHEIRQLYLRKKITGLGWGQQLMAWAMGHLRDRGTSHFYLSVFSENHGAIRFYQRHGFRKCGEYLYPVGGQHDLEFIMSRPC